MNRQPARDGLIAVTFAKSSNVSHSTRNLSVAKVAVAKIAVAEIAVAEIAVAEIAIDVGRGSGPSPRHMKRRAYVFFA